MRIERDVRTASRTPARSGGTEPARPPVVGAAPTASPRGRCACGGSCPRCPPAAGPRALRSRLTLGPARDAQEREADQVADQIVRGSDAPGPALAPRPLFGAVRAAAAGPAPAAVVRADVESRLHDLAGTGEPMSAALRADFEPRFGHDFGPVRLHTTGPATALARDLGAQAFAVGSDVFFGAGLFDPDSRAGRHLLAHELAHVVQQQRGAARQIRRSAPDGAPLPESAGLVIESGDPSLDGRPADVVATELRDMLVSYRDGVDTFTGSARQMQQAEERWALKLNLFGSLVELFNGVEMPAPGRWDEVFALWQQVAFELDLAIDAVAPESLADAGLAGQVALELFDQAFVLGQATSDEFLAYMQGFQGTAQTIHGVASVGRDLAFCALLATTVVVVAPAIAGVGLGSVATAGATTLAMGLVGADLEAKTRAGAAAVVETIDLGHDLFVEGQGWEAALDDIDWALIASEGIDGFQKGFIDGVLAYVGMALDKALAAGGAAATTLKPVGSSLLARFLRTAAAHAMASGASGAIVGALDAGAKAAVDGASFGEVVATMRDGFLIGAAAGAVLGGAGGVVSEAMATRMRAELARLPDLLVKDPADFARQYNALVESLSPRQRAAWDTEMRGRRFVDKKFFDPAKEAFEAGRSTVPPEHRFGTEAFEDWQQAAELLDQHARTGQPLTEEELRLAHEAAMDWKLSAEPGEFRTDDVIAGGQVGVGKRWSLLTPEQLLTLRRNPVIKLLDEGMADGVLTLRQQADGLQTAMIAYPPQQHVEQHMDDFFRWYADAMTSMDPTELAATAQRRLVSIHPFLDGNGRVSRLVMDDALQRSGLPPALLADPNLDFMVTKKAWIAEVRAGVVEAYETTVRHAGVFNAALKRLDGATAAATWTMILGLTSDPDPLVAWLYPDTAPVAPTEE